MKKIFIIIGLVSSIITIFIFVTGESSLNKTITTPLSRIEAEINNSENIKKESSEKKYIIGDKEYNTVKIGKQLWMAENLDFPIKG